MSREEHNGIDSKAPKGSTANPGHKEIKNEDSVLLRQNIADEERYFHEQNLSKERQRQEEFNKKKDDYSIDDYIASYEAQYDDRFRENMSDTFEKQNQKDRKTAEEYKQVSYPEEADKYRTLHRLDKPIRKIQYLNSRNIRIHIRKTARLIRWNLIVPELMNHTLRIMGTLTKIHRTRNGPIRNVWKQDRGIFLKHMANREDMKTTRKQRQ